MPLGLSLLRLVALFVLLASCKKGVQTGELHPPPDAPPWESRYAVPYDDSYTRQALQLGGRAPHDVLDQRLFAARMGYAHIIALVKVEQVFGRGRYQGSQQQFLDVTIEEVLVGELPKKTDMQQLLRVEANDDLPGNLQGQSMVLFLRWGSDQTPGYHHHLMPADAEVVATIRAMIDHAKSEGVVDQSGKERRRSRRQREQRERRK